MTHVLHKSVEQIWKLLKMGAIKRQEACAREKKCSQLEMARKVYLIECYKSVQLNVKFLKQWGTKERFR